jgi:C4-dicarboxylate transporter DctM subunit
MMPEHHEPGRCHPARADLPRFVLWIDLAGKYFDIVALMLAMATLAVLIAVVATQVFCRYVLDSPITWSEELATYLFAWLIFVGATVTVRRNEVPSLRLIVDALPARYASLVDNVAELLCLAISGVLLWKGAEACAALMHQRSPALQIPMGYPIFVMPLAGVGLCLHYLQRILTRWAGDSRFAVHALVAILMVAGAVAIPIYLIPDSWAIAGLLGAILLGFAIGMPVAFVLIWGVFFSLLIQQQPLMIVPETMFSASSNFILTAIPFFMFTGAVMEKGGLAERLVALAEALVGRFRGGLLLADIIVSAVFADMSGSAVSDTVAIGNIMLPGMMRRGYDRPFSTALQAASGTLGVLFPPSIATIIYAWVANVSVAQMFLASFLPAFLVLLSFVVIALVVAARRGFPRERPAGLREIGRSFSGASWALLTPVLILGGILSGAVTPSEAGVIVAVYALLTSRFIYRTMSFATLLEALSHAVIGTARVMFILTAAVLLGWQLTMLQVPQSLSDGMLQLSHNPLVLLLLLNLALVALHGVMETSATLILVVPLVVPIFAQLGVDPIHLGIIFLVNSALGLLTPPIGLVLYVVAPITGLKIETVARAAVPFLLAVVVDLVLVTIFPQISMIVPSLVR